MHDEHASDVKHRLALQADMVPIDSVRPAEDNPRLHSERQLDLIARSIEEFGFTYPILVDADGVIIAGHGRWLAARRLGLSEVPVIQADDWTPAQVRAYRVLDNRLTEMSVWDTDALPAYIDALDEVGISMDDLDLSGLIPDLDAPPVLDDDEADAPRIDRTDKTVTCPKCGHEFEPDA